MSQTMNLHCPRALNRLVCYTLVLLFLSVLGPETLVYAQENEAALQQLTPAAQQIARDLNQIRVAAGLPPLTLHPLLNQTAQSHVDDMLAHHFYGHMGSDGSNVRQRVQRAGYAAGGWASENWVAAQDPAAGMTWWMNDWIHRENILNTKWREMGVGVGVDPSGGMIFVTVFTAGQNPTGESLPLPAAESPTLGVPGAGIDYTIQAGDTLLGIALRYGLDWVVIAETNRLGEHSLLQIGQVLRLPGVQAKPATTTPPAVQAQPALPSPPAEPATQQTYSVQSGDTLLSIALHFELGWETVAAANGLRGDSLLQIGQTLIIPGGTQAPTTSSPAPTNPTTYTVAAGDTIISIALRFALDWQLLLRRNGLAENSTLQIGQVLRLQ